MRTVDDIRQLLLAGADKVSIMTAAVNDRRFVREAAEKFGSQCIVVAIDAKQTSPGRWEIFTHGGRKPTGIDAVEYAREVVALGAGEDPLTSMDRDGTRAGFDIALTRAVAHAVNVPLSIASGGGTPSSGRRHSRRTCDSRSGGVHFPFGEYSIREAKTYMAGAGLAMRLD